MASDFTQKGKLEIANQLLNVVTEAAYKVALPITGYVHDKDRDFVATADTDDLADFELAVTGYVGGFGGSGRKVPGSRTLTRDDTNARIEFSHATVNWPTLASGGTVIGVVHIVEKTADTDSWVVAFDDTNDVATNGGDLDYVPNAEGVLQF